jgi:hypothetical protein
MNIQLAAPLLALSFAGCLSDEAPLIKLDSHAVDALLYDKMPTPTGISFALSRDGHDPGNNGAKPDDCMRVLDTISITANGIPGKLASQGAYDSGSGGAENNCVAPWLEVELGARPATVDTVIDDGTATMDIMLALTPDGLYKVTSCGAAACLIL